MDPHRRLIAMLLAGILCFFIIPAHAITTTEKENNYAAAIMELEAYLETSGNSSADLAGIESAFRELGGYEQSRFLRYYVAVLMKIADEEYDFQLNTYLDMLEADEDFQKYLEESLKGSSIKSVDKLTAYATARKYEHEGRIAAAMEEYKKCLNFFGADERYTLLMEAQYQSGYERALDFLSNNDYAAAYYQFAELSGYSDSRQWMESIVRQLGYTPSSPTDNLMPVTGFIVKKSGASEVSLSWNKSNHATEYEVYYRKQNDVNWVFAGETINTNFSVTGLDADTFYDFKVNATSGKCITEDVIISASTTQKKNAEVTLAPKTTVSPNIVSVGDIVTFGHYEQDNVTSNGKEAIEWLVLDVKSKKMLLISQYVLDRVYLEDWYNTINEWLSKDFLNSAFTIEEQKAIHYSFLRSSSHTSYKVFLFSYEDAVSYFRKSKDRICQATTYAKKQGIMTITANGNSGWAIHDKTYSVSENGEIVKSDSYGIRPAMWVNIEKWYQLYNTDSYFSN